MPSPPNNKKQKMCVGREICNEPDIFLNVGHQDPPENHHGIGNREGKANYKRQSLMFQAFVISFDVNGFSEVF